ncbi:uncharacterized protein N7503_006794 [Penicillium pulvis]|uniref:uncharacterized protein n=1 Tax=Penicillium pulvis TaxID=1562058 RepID=UPI0025466C32|nr:uncharacterized protein N7503_006794 [Penicillium pulvis]KAJ5797498.1 hypothetical protein N7503_006794 [Penicillium pulvis]
MLSYFLWVADLYRSFDLRPSLVEVLLSRSDELSRKNLMERIEEAAPGYLEAEEEGGGFAGEYDIVQIEFEP